MSESKQLQPGAVESTLESGRRRMQWTISIGLWLAYALLVWSAIATGAYGHWVGDAGWKEGPPVFMFIVMPSTLVLLTFEVWMGPLRRRRTC